MKFILGTLLVLIGQTLAWFQMHGQFFNETFRKNPILVSVIGGAFVSFTFIYGTKLLAEHFEGSYWGARLITFAAGIIAFAFLTQFILDETLNLKTGVMLFLATSIVLIQVFWK